MHHLPLFHSHLELYSRGNGGACAGISGGKLHSGHQPDSSELQTSWTQQLNQDPRGFSSCQQLPEFPTLRQIGGAFGDGGSYQQLLTAPMTSLSKPPPSSSSPPASSLSSDKIQQLITMYRAHCQRVMDSVNKFSFTEIPHLFTHFWQELPPHIAGLLGQNLVVTLVGACDAILYRTILKAVLPTAIQMFPENVIKIIRKFADDVVGSLQYSLKQQHVPENLVYVKMKRT